MENPEQAFVDYASSHTDEAGGKWFTSKPEQNNLGDTYNPSWKIHPNLRWRQPQNSQNNFSNPPNHFQPSGSFLSRPFNNKPQNFNNQSNLEGLVSSFMASQDTRLSKFKAAFKQQQSEMTNKIETFLKAINDRTMGALPSDTVKNPKLNVNSTSSVLSACSCPMKDPQSSSRPLNSINAIKLFDEESEESKEDVNEEVKEEEEDDPEYINTNLPSPSNPSISFIIEKVCMLNLFLESLNLVPSSSNTQFICTKENNGDIMIVEIIKKYDDSSEEESEEDASIVTRELGVEYFDRFLTRSKLTYHKYLMCAPKPSMFLRNPIIIGGSPSNLKIPCNIGHLEPKEDHKGIRGISNFIRRIRGMHIFVGNFTYVLDFMIVEDISSIIDPRLSQVVLEKPFAEISNMSRDLSLGIVRFANGMMRLLIRCLIR
ncbi:hypothetical protein Tco_0826225 [Tanacetum coccineum]